MAQAIKMDKICFTKEELIDMMEEIMQIYEAAMMHIRRAKIRRAMLEKALRNWK